MSNDIPLKWQIYTATDPTVERIIPELAVEIGLNESIVLMQIVFWIKTSNNIQNGTYWTYQSLRDMHEKAFPYWSVMTIQRTIQTLEKAGYITTGNFNKRKGDKTQWFALVPDKLSSLKSVLVMPMNGTTLPETPTREKEVSPEVYQNDTRVYQNDTTLPETPTREKEKESAPNGTHGKSPKAKAGKVREVDPYFEAIATVWHTRAGGFIGGVKSMMLGKATGKSQYAKGNFDEPVVDPQEILDFGVWAWKRVESRSAPNNGQKPELPTYAVTIQKWFYDFRDDRRAHAVTPAAPTPEAPWTTSGDYFKWRAEQLESGL